MTITAVPTVQFTEEEIDFIFDEISEELENLRDRRRFGDEEASEIEDALEDYSKKLTEKCDANEKDGLYTIKLDEEFYSWVPELLESANDFYNQNCDDEEFIKDVEWDPEGYKATLDAIEEKI